MAFQEKQSFKNDSTHNKNLTNFALKEVKLGIIGLGHMGSYHASVCSLVPHVILHAVADPIKLNWQKIQNDRVIKTSSYKDWLEQVDAVIIAVPTDLHYAIAKECLLADKHILLEKPLTKNLMQAQELFELAQDRNCALHIGHVERFNGAVQEMKKIIHKPYLIESQRMGPFSSRVQKDSVILDLMIHDLDIILSMVDSSVTEVNVIARSIKSSLADIGLVQLQFANGTAANIISSRASQIKRRMMSVHQENACIQLDFTTQDISIHHSTNSSIKVGHNQLEYKQEGMIERLFVYKENALKSEIEHFIKTIHTGKNLVNPKQDLETLKLTLMLEKKLMI